LEENGTTIHLHRLRFISSTGKIWNSLFYRPSLMLRLTCVMLEKFLYKFDDIQKMRIRFR